MSEVRRRYKLGEVLGQGAYGVVYKAWDGVENKDVAVKVINLEDAGDEIETIQEEIVVMASSQHNIEESNLVRYFGRYRGIAFPIPHPPLVPPLTQTLLFSLHRNIPPLPPSL
jgi:serine/threonine protein kinase